ncbi:hypothetical protein CY35_17G099000 [Sphagnum magellanicum]|nr:hypothetical protein CY35_17G099000 [Sphagnum magellanicum]
MGSPISVENGTSLLINRQQCMPLSEKPLETQEILETVEHKLSDEATTSSDSQNVNGFSLGLDLCKKTREICSPISVENGASLLINRQQCKLLSKKLLETQEMLEKVEHKLSDEGITTSESPDISQLAHELVHVLKTAHKTVVKDCICNGKWIESALRQGGDSKEAFGEILYDLQWYTFLMRTFFKLPFPDCSTLPSWHLQPADCDRKLIEADDNMLLTAARQDQEELKVLLNDLKGNHACDGKRCTGNDISMQCLATQLLNKLKFQNEFQALPATKKMEYHEQLHEVDNNKLSQWPLVLLVPMQDLPKGNLLGEGSCGRVHETNWLGETYAMKMPKYGNMEVCKQEIAALAGLQHPHIMCLVCCAEEEMKCLYVMERMDKSLFEILEDGPLPLIRSLDLMLQIAEGMNYLHSMDLVHRDLKPGNILVKCDKPGSQCSILAPEPFWIAKICDFGNTKAKMESAVYNEQTINIGTTMFMAPELYKLEPGEKEPEIFHPKKIDVYSFGLLCLAVLIGEPTPFPYTELIPSETFKDRVRKGKRPKLPPNCPDHLSSLVQQCWDANPVERPNFHDICTTLRYIKGLQLLTGEDRPSLNDIVKVPRSNRMAKSSSSQVLEEEQGTSTSQGEGMSTRDDNVVTEPRTVTSSSSQVLVEEQGTSTSQGVVPPKTMGGGMSTPNDNVVSEPRTVTSSSSQVLVEEQGTSTSQGGGMSTPNDNVVREPSCLCCCWR